MANLVQIILGLQNTAQRSVGLLGQQYIRSVSFAEKILKQPKVLTNSIVVTSAGITLIEILRARMQQLGRAKTQVILQYTNGSRQLMENLLNVSNAVVRVLLIGLTRVASILEITEMIGYTYVGNATFTTTKETKCLRDIRKRYAKFIGKEEEWQTITPVLR